MRHNAPDSQHHVRRINAFRANSEAAAAADASLFLRHGGAVSTMRGWKSSRLREYQPELWADGSLLA